MNIGLGYALFVSVVCAFFGWTNYGFVNFQTTKPVVCGTLVGLILGDVQTGIVIGGTLTLVYMGVQGIGAEYGFPGELPPVWRESQGAGDHLRPSAGAVATGRTKHKYYVNLERKRSHFYELPPYYPGKH